MKLPKHIQNYILKVHRSEITDNNLHPLCKTALQEHCKKQQGSFVKRNPHFFSSQVKCLSRIKNITDMIGYMEM